jgi:hypothetical protein
MVEINSGNSGLGAQLQAQLQAGSGKRAVRSVVDLTPRATDVIRDQLKGQQGIRSEADRQAPPQRSSRSTELSSSRELQVASEKVASLNANNREAPVGRLSVQAGIQRDIPLGQIVDIRV